MTTPPATELIRLETSDYFLAEGPVWDPDRSRLSWVDIEEGLVLHAAFDGARLGEVTRIEIGELTGCALPISGGRFLCGLSSQLAIVGDEGVIARSRALIPEGLRFNDGKIDPQGRLVIGSLRVAGVDWKQHLLRLEHDGTVTQLDSDLGISNGLGWSPDGAWLYSVDTERNMVFRRAYGDGVPGERHEFLSCDGYPDGITVDSEGDIWVSLFGGCRVERYASDGTLRADATIDAGGLHVSSVEFVGPDLATLVLTTGMPDIPEGPEYRIDGDGGLYVTAPGAHGMLPTRWTEIELPS